MAPAGAQTQVALIYPRVVSHTRARADLTRLAQLGGWSMNSASVRDEDVRTSDGRSLGKQTEVTATLWNGLPLQNGAFRLQPFVDALSDKNRIELLFFAPPDASFRGIRDYESSAVSVQLLRAGGPYRYLIQVKQHGKPLPALPMTQSAAPAQSGEPEPTMPARSSAGAMGKVLAAAAAAALLVLGGWVLWDRWHARPAERTARRLTRP